MPSDTRIDIEIASPETEETVGAMVARALAADPWFLVFRDSQPVRTSISVNGTVA